MNRRAQLRERLRRLPKAELHLHLEGTVTPAALWSLAQRHGGSLTDEAACRALYNFTDFDGFIRLYKAISVHLATPDDYATAVRLMAGNLAAQGIVYAEVFFSIGILLWKQAAVAEFFAAAEAARRAAETETGVKIAWIADAVRQFGPDHLHRVLDAVETLRSSSIVAIGIGGDERAAPPEWFVDGYQRARAMGLHTTAHAGETAGPSSIRGAMNDLKVERIGHGLRAFEDPALVTELAACGIGLDVCPTSNLRTGCWPDLASHPALDYYKRGCKLVIGSDDPGIFGVDLLDEYCLASDHFGLPWEDLARIVGNSFTASFLPLSEQSRLRNIAFPAIATTYVANRAEPS